VKKGTSEIPIPNYTGFTLTDEFHTCACSNVRVLATSDTFLAKMDGLGSAD
jgi:hypothetical protein